MSRLAPAAAVALLACSGGASLAPPPPPIGAIGLSEAAYAVSEASPTVALTLRRTGGNAGQVSVYYEVSRGTATPQEDYEDAVYGVMTWPAGDAADRVVPVAIHQDALVEGDETFTISLSGVTGGAALGTATARVTIVDDDTPPAGALRFAAQAYEADEDVASATITVERSGGSAGAVSVLCATGTGSATPEADYSAAGQVLSWPDGDASPRTLTIPILDDALPEPYEAVPIQLSSATGGAAIAGPATVALTIRNDDSVVAFGAPAYAAAENGGATWVQVTKQGETPPVQAQVVVTGGTATVGADYAALVGSALSWGERETGTLGVAITPLNDALQEGDETIVLGLASLTGGATAGAPSTAIVTIADDEPPAQGMLELTKATYPVSNYAGTVAISVRRFGGSRGAVGVAYATSDGTAVAGQDYSATSGTLAWADGDTAEKTFLVPIADDVVNEAPETVALTLTAPTGGAALGPRRTAAISISDDWTQVWGQPSGPVLLRSATGLWDAYAVESPSVVRLGPSSFVMYYQGGQNAGNLNELRRIGRAVSTDGIAWTREPAAAVASGWVLEHGDAGKFDEFGVGKPSVLFDGTTWHMWYSNMSTNLNDDVAAVPRIGYATSADGISWTRQNGGDAVLAPGATGDDVAGVSDPSVVLDGATYRMWYTAHKEAYTTQIALATSADGVTWTKQGVVLPNQPLGSFDNWELSQPAVVKDGATFRMWYASRASSTARLMYAASANGVDWQRFGVPLVDPTSSYDWNYYPHGGPTALKDGERWLVWYHADGLAYSGLGIGLLSNP